MHLVSSPVSLTSSRPLVHYWRAVLGVCSDYIPLGPWAMDIGMGAIAMELDARTRGNSKDSKEGSTFPLGFMVRLCNVGWAYQWRGNDVATVLDPWISLRKPSDRPLRAEGQHPNWLLDLSSPITRSTRTFNPHPGLQTLCQYLWAAHDTQPCTLVGAGSWQLLAVGSSVGLAPVSQSPVTNLATQTRQSPIHALRSTQSRRVNRGLKCQRVAAISRTEDSNPAARYDAHQPGKAHTVQHGCALDPVKGAWCGGSAAAPAPTL